MPGPSRSSSLPEQRLGLGLGLVLLLAIAGCADRVLGPVRSALSRVDSLAVLAADQLARQDSAAYTVELSQKAATFAFPAYSAVVRFGHPFGITSLRLRDQPVDFCHPSLPLADWEWFWFDQEGSRVSLKLIEPDWAQPGFERRLGQVVLRFLRQDALEPGIELEVEYRLRTQGAEFEVQYAIHNRSGKRLANPYIMVGFPGFSNHGWISEVATALQVRTPISPYTNFRDEALADGRSEYLLLRHDVAPRLNPQILEGRIAASAAGQRYALQASCEPGPGVEQVYSAHTNKPGYLTSHLYVFLQDMEPGESRQVLVRYALWRP